MFKVKHKESGEIYTVYAVGVTMFLIYEPIYNDNCWIWTPMEDYKPVEEG